ncbi:hypothetical protein [Pseudonocardia sp. Ae717_Ps2]|uniref:hypothetical protein n=1 Tax=Pseudonocardia sp. Ae717_Ps2 TaxID=1885573 RepID=UPI00130104CE|nr:hypothetical protein [Pseudonocardia sp. Ae717_Ps2]
MTTDQDPATGAVPTLRDRMRAAGMSDERIAYHAEANAIALDGELARGLDQPAPPGTRWHFVGR